MSVTGDQMELREAEIRAHYPAALAMLEGVDHTPRMARPAEPRTEERSAGLGARRRFRSTTPGLATRATTARPEGVRLIERVESVTEDALISRRQAGVLQSLRRALAIALAVGEAFSERTGLAALKKKNLEGRLATAEAQEFSALLGAEALAVLHVFANATGFLLGPMAEETSVEIGALDEVLTENA